MSNWAYRVQVAGLSQAKHLSRFSFQNNGQQAESLCEGYARRHKNKNINVTVQAFADKARQRQERLVRPLELGGTGPTPPYTFLVDAANASRQALLHSQEVKQFLNAFQEVHCLPVSRRPASSLLFSVISASANYHQVA